MRKLIFVGILVLAMSGLALAQDFPKYEVFGGYSYMRSDLGNTGNVIGSYYNSDFSAGQGNAHGFEAAFTYNLSSWFGIKADFSAHFGKVKMDGTDVYKYDQPDEYYNAYTDTYKQTGSVDYRQYTYLFGPEFTYRKYEKFRPFAHVLFGFTQIDMHKVNLASTESEQYESGSGWYYTRSIIGSAKNTSFATAAGGGVDITVNKKISLRLPQIDYVLPTLRSFKIDVTEKQDDYYGQSTSGEHYYSRTDQYSWRVPTNRFNNVRMSAGIVYKF